MYKIQIMGPHDFDNFDYIYKTLEFLDEMQTFPNGWGILSHNKTIWDSMAEWYAVETNKDFVYAADSDKADYCIFFQDKANPLDMSIYEAFKKQTGIPYRIMNYTSI